ncbi:MAG: amino acid adenylation domain-containing protein [Tatlockia sp.]|nr:amino acid adenylation domain-containing protein [Tatlockia sp.]
MKEKRSLSLSQKRFWFEWKWARSRAAYNTPLMFELEGELNVSALEEALNCFVNDYDEGCRTTFEEYGEEVYRIIHDHVPMVLEKIQGPIDYLPTLRHEFDLSQLPLFKFELVRLTADKYLLILNFHHIISDALSAKYFIDFLSQQYNQLVDVENLLAVSHLFEEHVELEQNLKAEDSVLYWENLLAKQKLWIDLPKKTVVNVNDEAESIYRTLDQNQTASLKQFARQMGTTPSIVLSAIFGVLLARYSGESQVVLNYPIDMRRPISKKAIGCFVNHVPCLVDIEAEDNFSTLIKKLTVQRKITRQHQYCSLMDIVAHLRNKKVLDSDDFLNVSITEAQLAPVPLDFKGLQVKTMPCTSQLMINDLNLSYQLDEHLAIRLDYRSCFFERFFIDQFLNHFLQLLKSGIKEPEKLILEHNFFDAQEKNLLMAWENPAQIKSTPATVLSLFETQVLKTPNKIALVFGEEQLTYQQLANLSSEFAKHLLIHYKKCYGQAMPKGLLIGISLARGSELVIAILAVLKTGAAYVPLDPAYPIARLESMVEDSNIAMLIANSLSEFFPYDERRLAITRTPICGDKGFQFPELPALSDLAYVLYTSGSTGKPKGVMIEHKSLSNVLLAFQQQLQIGKEDSWASVTSPSFDIFGLELFLPLISGAKLVLISPKLIEEPPTLANYLSLLSPTIIQATPSFWSMLFLLDWKGDSKNLTVLSGGEPLSEQLRSYLLSISKCALNVYGPTETTIWSTSHEMAENESVSIIGKPLRNTMVRVLNKALQQVPFGTIGELYIAGEGVARGYWGKSEKELQQSFPFLELENETKRFYRTGDLVSWLPNGILEYKGRADNQVKIRGYRIELAEIEALVLENPKVWQCVVVAKGEINDKSLIAFVVTKKNEVLDDEQLTHYLEQKLPSHALPKILFIKEFPLLPNGKIDKKELLALANQSQNKLASLAKTTEENLILGLWQELFPNIAFTVDDHFFKLGGHSLQAVQLAVRLQTLFGIEVPVRTIREFPTIKRLTCWVREQKNIAIMNSKSAERTKGPLSLSQRYLWIFEKIENSAHYNLIFAQKLRGALHLEALNASVNELIARHDVLRTIFTEANGETSQVVMPYRPIEVIIENIEESSLATIIEEEVQTQFQLTESPMIRVRLFALSDIEQVLVFCLPHIVIDGWSLNVLSEELSELYQEFAEGFEPKLKRPAFQYLDFVEWQRNSLQGDYLKGLEQFWQKALAEYQPLSLPTDKPKPPVFTYRGEIYRFQIENTITKKLHTLASVEGVTLFSICLSAFAILLNRYSNQDDLIIGTATANRTSLPFERTIGLFVNTLALRLQLSGDMKLGELFQQAMDVTLAAHDHQALPFESLVDLLKADRDPSRPPLVQVMIVLQTANEDYHLKLKGLTTEVVPVDTGSAKFELMLTLHETSSGLDAELEFAKDLFTQPTIEKLAKHFQQLLSSFIESSEEPIHRLTMLTPEEKQLLSNQWNRPDFNYQSTKTLAQLFSEQVNKHPNRVALRFEGESMSYLELDIRANQLAHALLQKVEGQLPVDSLIGICLDREPALIVAILAILKAGAAYVPLDPNYPSDRLKFIIDDSSISLLITRQTFIDEHQFQESLDLKQLINLDEISNEEQLLTPIIKNLTDLAYVIYTSGSTGEPKGALMTEANVTRLFAVTEPLFNFKETDVWCLFHSFAFDFSVWEIWGALVHGASLVIVPYETSRNTRLFRELLKDERVNILNQTPSAFSKLIQEDCKRGDQLALDYVIFGGEALNYRSLLQWLEKYGSKNPDLVNMYGITETTVHVTWHLINQKEIREGYGSKIGKLLPDLNAYVLDSYGGLVPVGVPGELYVSGPGLARGYLNREDLSKRVFLIGEDNIRRYKTGDLVRWLPDGSLEYLGRKDKQVKVNGFRIETGEIESKILELKGIKDALVTLSVDKRLIAYYIPLNEKFNEELLDHYLRQQLPEYMVPVCYQQIDSFPMTVNGKVDLNRLPIPLFKQSKSLIAPGNSLEQLLADIWQEVLHVKNIGINDNFFALGGDSMLTISVVTRARERGLTLSAKSLFRYPTIASLALNLTNKDKIEFADLSPFELLNAEDKTQVRNLGEDAYPLTELQKGMVFYSEMNQESTTYIDVISCYLEGHFNLNTFEEVLSNCVAEHPVLRTSFAINGFSVPMQIVHEKSSYQCKVIELEHLEVNQQQEVLDEWLSKEIRTHFDLKKPPLWRITFHHLKKDYYYFSLTCHHAILDGWSVALFITQLFKKYEERISGILKNQQHGPLKTQFNHYVREEINRIQSSEQTAFWQQQLDEVPPLLLSESSSIAKAQLKRVFLEIPSSLSQQLFAMAATNQSNIDNLLLAVHLWTLSQLTGLDRVITGIATHGRSDHEDGDKVLGLFLNSTPFPINLQTENWSDLIAKIIKEKRKISDFQQFPLSKIQQLKANQQLFDTLFNFVNFHVFDALKDFKTLKITAGKTYEETNYTLVAQTGIHPETKQLEYQLIYLANKLNSDQIKVIQDLYQVGLYSIAQNGSLPDVESLAPYLSWMRFNNWENTNPHNQTVHELFDQQVQLYPHHIALSDDEGSMTYLQLQEKADRMANRLQQQCLAIHHEPLKPDSLIGVSIEPGSALIITILAILKAGAAYLPLDKAYGTNRLKSMVSHASPRLIIVDDDDLFPVEELKLLCINFNGLSTQPIEKTFKNPVSGNNLAYLMFTSGSTGAPKALMIEHRSIVRLVKKTNYIEIQPKDIIAQASNPNFDAFTFEVWGALLNGATLKCATRKTILNAQLFAKFLLKEKISILWLTARLLDQFVTAGYANMFKNLRYLLAGGDILNKSTLATILNSVEGRPQHLLNGYGPTENTTFSTTHEITLDSLAYTSIPIGQPISQTEIYVLSKQMKPIPAGFEGELYLGGAGLARGYFQNESLTRERFIANPFCTGESIYKTGDKVVALPNGELLFLGRNDRQLKIRGFRVELDEMERLILTHPQISQAVIVAKEGAGDKQLIAYCVLSSETSLERLWQELRQKMPANLLPTKISIIDAIPLTANGKLDLTRLPKEENAAKNYVEAKTEVEEQLVSIWSQVLELEQISIKDNFFDLGGNSLLIIQLRSLIQDAFDQVVSVTDIFQYPTIQSFSKFLSGHQKQSSTKGRDIQAKRKAFRQQQRLKNNKRQEHVE